MKKVFLDANILYSNTARGLFIWLSKNGAIEIYWSKEAWEEAFSNFEEKNGLTEGLKFRTSMQKNAISSYPNNTVTLNPFTPVGLKDKDDEHILAAAKQTKADFVITQDKIFLSENLNAHSIRAIKHALLF